MGKDVVVLGGGVGGLSAAHELVERGFKVRVFESKSTFGGKARSSFVPGSGTQGRRDLPGEHGFRFFPSFYRHLPDTMRRIPFQNQAKGVLDNLVGTSRTLIARQSPPEELALLARFPRTRSDLRVMYEATKSDLGLSWADLLFFQQRVLVLLTSCRSRRLLEYEQIPWWQFIEADSRSARYAQYFGEIAVRYLVAMSPRKASTRTVGNIGLQLSLGHLTPDADVDRILNGPTDDVWLRPWVDYLGKRGVEFHLGHRVTKFCMANGQIDCVEVEGLDGAERISADYFVSAIPVERMSALVGPELIAGDPQLGRIHEVTTDWMVGIQFFLSRDVPIEKGHVVFVDAPWALTAISQAQFWPGTDLSQFGDGRVRGVLSVVISNWDAPGDYSGCPAKQCTPTQIKDEVWREVKDHLNDMGTTVLSDADLVDHYLADSVRFLDDGTVVDDEPLVINTVDSWANRPDAESRIPNLLLASDYVRTNTDLATMEAANEAARRAVNGILRREGRSSTEFCRIWRLEEPWWFRPFAKVDEWRFRQGKPHLLYSGARPSKRVRAS